MRKLSYKLVTLPEIVTQIDSNELVAVDVETKGFYGEILLVQFYQTGWSDALLVELPELLHLSMILKKLHIVCHNTSYEVTTMQRQLGKLLQIQSKKWQPKNWEDTLLLAKLRYPTKERFSLDLCYTYALGFDPYLAHNLDKKILQKADFSVLTEDKLNYAAIDVFYLLDLYNACVIEHNESYKLDKAATDCAFDFQTNGLAISIAAINKLKKANLARVEELAVPINCNSWKQVRPYIGEEESDGLALATFALEGNDKARDVQETRKLLKVNSFLAKYIAENHEIQDEADSEVVNRIYGSFGFTTRSGRGRCGNQNLQQLPRSTKGVFEAPSGRVIVMSDYSQLELRYAAAVADETHMVDLFRQGVDLHQATADRMNVPRQQAKTCNFNLLYGGSAHMLRSIFIKEAGLLIPISQVKQLKKAWHNLWPMLTRWQDRQTRDWQNNLLHTTILGRKFKAKLYTDAMNLPIQGGAADIAKLAMHKIYKRKSTKHMMVNFVHDSFIFETDNDPAVYEPLAKIIAESMQEAWFELTKHTLVYDVPMPVNVKVGKNWGNLDYERETPIYQLELE